jgi:hypothetical protein
MFQGHCNGWARQGAGRWRLKRRIPPIETHARLTWPGLYGPRSSVRVPKGHESEGGSVLIVDRAPLKRNVVDEPGRRGT